MRSQNVAQNPADAVECVVGSTVQGSVDATATEPKVYVEDVGLDCVKGLQRSVHGKIGTRNLENLQYPFNFQFQFAHFVVKNISI